MRLAWFTPWPPQRSGIAGRSAELVAALAARGHAIDVFVDEAAVRPEGRIAGDAPLPGDVRVQSAHEFVWRVLQQQYDLVVYQLGNSALHAYMWPYLVRWPGLVVLHDGRLHHARAHALLSRGRLDDYRAEVASNHPALDALVAEFAIAGFGGPYYYDWPMTATAVESARAVAAHARGTAAELRARYPGRVVDYLPLGEGLPEPPSAVARQDARVTLGVGPDSVVFGVFGALTAEKRVPEIIRAFAATFAREPEARLVLVGAVDPLIDLPRLIAESGAGAAIICAKADDDTSFDQMIGAVDVSLNLRWPTARETSGPWVRALSAARPTVVIDLAHQTHVPALDPRTWEALPHNMGAGDPVTVAIDILDEAHSLRLAMRRLAGDAALRERLGRAARTYWEAEHSVARMVEAYDTLIAKAASLPLPVPPAGHHRPEAYANTILSEAGLPPCTLF